MKKVYIYGIAGLLYLIVLLCLAYMTYKIESVIHGPEWIWVIINFMLGCWAYDAFLIPIYNIIKNKFN